MRTVVLALALCGLCCAPLLAQDKQQPAKQQEKSDELAKKVLGQKLPPTKSPAAEEVAEKQEQEINRNWNSALRNYNGIIDNQDEAELRSMEQRIEANLSMVKNQNTALTDSQKKLRELKLRYARRFTILKSGFEQGRLDKKNYVTKLRSLSDEFEFQLRALVGDVSFYRKEATSTKLRLKNLQQIHKINQMTHGRRRPKQSSPESSALEKLLQSIRAAGRFKVRNVFDAADCRHFR